MHDPEARVLETLESLGVAYDLLPCEPEFADTAKFCARYGSPLETAANTILVASKKEPRTFALCVVLATTRLDVNRAVRDVLGVGRLSFASAEEMRTVTGMEVGGVTPFSLPAGIALLVDDAVLACERVVMGTGGRTSKIRLDPSALLRLPGARAAVITKPTG